MADSPTIQLDETDFVGEEDVKEEEAVEQQPATEESSPEEKKEAEVADPAKEAEGDEATEDEESKEEETADEETGEEKPQGKAEERKQQLSGEIRDLVGQRNAIKQEVERLNAQVYQPQTPQQLVDQGMTETDARIAAMEQKVELSDYNNRVAEAQLVISSESDRVIREFPMFDPNSSAFKPDVAAQAADILRSSLLVDPNTNQVIGSNVSPYQLYKTIASANQASAVENQLAGQRATEKMLASTDAPGSAVPKEKKEDPFIVGLLGK